MGIAREILSKNAVFFTGIRRPADMTAERAGENFLKSPGFRAANQNGIRIPDIPAKTGQDRLSGENCGYFIVFRAKMLIHGTAPALFHSFRNPYCYYY